MCLPDLVWLKTCKHELEPAHTVVQLSNGSLQAIPHAAGGDTAPAERDRS